MSETPDCANCQKQAEQIKRLEAWHKRRNSYIEHPAEDLTKWRVYDRMPIQISPHSVVMVTLYESHGHLHDIWLTDHPDNARQFDGLYDRAAQQLRQQFEGHDCIAFWQALKAEAEKGIAEWEAAKRK